MQRILGVDLVARNVLHHTWVATTHHDTAVFGRDEVFGYRHAPRVIMMRLHDHCATVRIEQEVSRKRQITFALKKRLGPIVEENVADNLIAIPLAGPVQRKMPHEEIGPGCVTDRSIAML